MMASIAGGTRVGRVCSVAFGLIARRVGRVTRIAMVGCASGRTRTIERDTKGAKTRFIAPAYGKMLWGGRRDFLPGSQEVKWRDGNPLTNSTVPAPENGGIRKLTAHLARLGCLRSVMVLGAVKGRAQARAARGFIP